MALCWLQGIRENVMRYKNKMIFLHLRKLKNNPFVNVMLKLSLIHFNDKIIIE